MDLPAIFALLNFTNFKISEHFVMFVMNSNKKYKY